jgi:hypothetical protein
MEDYCLLSLNDLKQKLTERRASWQNAHEPRSDAGHALKIEARQVERL